MKRFLLILATISIYSTFIKAQDSGTLDLTFNAHQTGKGNGPNGIVTESLFQPDGKIVIVGGFSEINAVSRLGLARLNQDGTLDNSFKSEVGGIQINYANVNTIALQSDGKILVGGNSIIINNIQFKFVRINPDGTLDSTFILGNQTNINTINKIALHPDGKIVIGGSFTSIQGITRNGIARLNSNGNIDSSFNPGTGGSPSGNISSLAIQADGKIVAAGSFSSFNGQPKSRLVRLNYNGSVDTNFTYSGTFFGGTISQLGIQSDGKILFSRTATALTRINPSGSVDTDFIPQTGTSGEISTFAIQPDGKILLGGRITSYNGIPTGRLIRVFNNGTLDEEFSHDHDFDTNPSKGNVSNISLSNEGKILVSGTLYFDNDVVRSNLSQLEPNGSLDPDFIPGNIGPNGSIDAVEILEDGKILVIGGFSTYDGIKRERLARLLQDGTLDLEFKAEIDNDPWIRDMAVLKDGSILIAGSISTELYNQEPYLIRLYPDGKRDYTFKLELGIEGDYFGISDITLQSDGKIFVSGYNEDIGPLTFLIRLNNDGSLDPTFSLRNIQGADDVRQGVNEVLIQPDGKILIFGGFTRYEGVFVGGLARLFPDGTFDSSFDPGTGVYGSDDTDYNGITKALLQDDGKILIYGLNSFNGIEKPNRVVRINSDGSLDSSFNPALRVNALGVIEPNGKILVYSNENNTNFLRKLNNNGSIDTRFEPVKVSFVQSSYFNFNNIYLQKDGKILISGIFKSINNISRINLARILNDPDGCEIDIRVKSEIVLQLDQDGKGRLTTEMVDDGSCSNCGSVKLELDKCDFSCDDLGEQTVGFKVTDKKGNTESMEVKVTVVDDLLPTLDENINQQSFVWLIQSGSSFTLPDFRSIIGADDNCSFEVKQSPLPGTKFTTPQNTNIEFEVKDCSGNTQTARLNFTLLVLNLNLSSPNDRITNGEISGHLKVAWNTPFNKIVNGMLRFEEGSNMEMINKIEWKSEKYKPLTPGLHFITANIKNSLFENMDLNLEIPVSVDIKPLAENIVISKNILSRNLQSGEIIGILNTVDPADNIHEYTVSENPDFYIEKNVLVWKGNGIPDLKMKVTVHSRDRAGQTISREITLEREYSEANSVFVFPNPAVSEVNIEVRLAESSEITIRIIDPNGRLVFEEKETQHGPFMRQFLLDGLSPGLYLITVQDDFQVITKRLVKR